MKILIVDDSPDALALARVRLGKENLKIITADSGGEGLKLAKSEKPDLILLDVDMPGMSGFSVCRKLKTSEDLCMTPVIFLTGSDNTQDKIKGLNIGAVDYVTKPFDAFELKARVNAALRTKRMQDMLIEYANIDPLTGIPNRRALMERLRKEWMRIERHGGTLSFIMADIDHFKRVNDTYGHSIGDEVLRRVAQAIVSQCRKIDLPARYGGEEFAVVVPDESVKNAAELAERCRQATSDILIHVGDENVQVAASFGVAEISDISSVKTPVETVITAADEALYQAKEAGRNQVVTDNHTKLQMAS